MIVRIAGVVAVAMMVCFAFNSRIVELLEHPLNTVDPSLIAKLQVLRITEPFEISVQVSFYAGIVISFPVILYYIAQFVLPALTRKERKYVMPAIAIGFGLFLTGVLFGFFVILPRALGFFFNYAKDLHMLPMWTVSEYFSFVTRITVAFGFAFELPAVVLVLVHFRVLSYAFLSRTRSYAIVILLVLAMIIAPSPDVMTFFALGGPMILLYEACIWLAWIMERRRDRLDQETSGQA